jgi:hypothetical protein
MRRLTFLLVASLVFASACKNKGEVSVEILAHDSVSELRIGNRNIDVDSGATKLLGINLPAGEYDVTWKSGADLFAARVRIESNEDNYLLLIDKEPWLEVDGGMKVIEPASKDLRETF